MKGSKGQKTPFHPFTFFYLFTFTSRAHSSGANGLWNLATRYPERWAALVPAAPTRFPDVEQVKRFPCWIFQGDVDEYIPVARVRKFVSDLKAANAEVRYTEYAKELHVIWQKVYNTEELYEWLATKKKF